MQRLLCAPRLGRRAAVAQPARALLQDAALRHAHQQPAQLLLALLAQPGLQRLLAARVCNYGHRARCGPHRRVPRVLPAARGRRHRVSHEVQAARSARAALQPVCRAHARHQRRSRRRRRQLCPGNQPGAGAGCRHPRLQHPDADGCHRRAQRRRWRRWWRCRRRARRRPARAAAVERVSRRRLPAASAAADGGRRRRRRSSSSSWQRAAAVLRVPPAAEQRCSSRRHRWCWRCSVCAGTARHRRPSSSSSRRALWRCTSKSSRASGASRRRWCCCGAAGVDGCGARRSRRSSGGGRRHRRRRPAAAIRQPATQGAVARGAGTQAAQTTVRWLFNHASVGCSTMLRWVHQAASLQLHSLCPCCCCTCMLLERPHSLAESDVYWCWCG